MDIFLVETNPRFNPLLKRYEINKKNTNVEKSFRSMSCKMLKRFIWNAFDKNFIFLLLMTSFEDDRSPLLPPRSVDGRHQHQIVEKSWLVLVIAIK